MKLFNKKEDTNKDPRVIIKARENRDFIEAMLYLIPFFIGVVIFTLYPAGFVLTTAFKEGYKYLTGEFDALSLSNFDFVINDPNFKIALKNTTIYVFTVVPIATIIAIIVATLLNQKIKGMAIFQTAYFLPLVTSATAAGQAWKYMFHQKYGVINYLLNLIGIESIPWLTNPTYNLPAVIIFGIWNMLPFTIILLLSGLQNIDPQYYTAAKVDGAKTLKIFFRITVPLLAPTICLCLIINMISAFKVYNEIFPLFNGNPGIANNLYTVVYYIYRTFYIDWKFGRACAASVILFLIIFVLTRLQLFIQKKWTN